MITNLNYVNGFPVLAMLTDETSMTAQTIVVCDRGQSERDRYVVWTVAMLGGKVEARHGRYVATYARALTIAAERAAEAPEKLSPEAEKRAMADQALAAHRAVAFCDDANVCAWNTPTYRASQRLLLASIRAAYGLSALKAQRVYDVWGDCGESLAYCVEYVKTHRESGAYSR